MSKSEKAIERGILQFLNTQVPKVYKAKCRAVKWTQHGRQRGNPDIICAVEGRLFLFEVKKPEGGRLTKLQEATMKEWRNAGVVAEVVVSLEDVKGHLDKHLTDML